MEFVFIVYQAEGYQNILKLSCRQLAFTSWKLFYKRERGLKMVSVPHFLYVFLKKNTSLVIYFYTFLEKSCRKLFKETSFEPFLLFKKALNDIKAIGLQLSVNIL